MSTTLASVPSTYQKALDLVEGSRDGVAGAGNNTWVTRTYDNGLQGFDVTLHVTRIATIHVDDSVTLRTGGWRTVTTKDRLNRVLGNRGRVFSIRGEWRFQPTRDLSIDHVPFVEGLHVGADGTPWPEDVPVRVLRRPELIGTRCECGAPFDPELEHRTNSEWKGGYTCNR